MEANAIIPTPASTFSSSTGATPSVGQHTSSSMADAASVATEVVNAANDFSTFTRFAELPFELRSIIWKLSRRKLWHDWGTPFQVERCSTSRANGVAKVRDSSRSRAIPAILHASQESRSSALESLDYFDAAWDGQPVYFDFRKDKLFLTSDVLKIICGVTYDRVPPPPGSITRWRASLNWQPWQAKLRYLQFAEMPLLDYGDLRNMSTLETIVIWRANFARFKMQDADGKRRTLDIHTKKDLSTALNSWTGYETGLWTGAKDKLPALLIEPCFRRRYPDH